MRKGYIEEKASSNMSLNKRGQLTIIIIIAVAIVAIAAFILFNGVSVSGGDVNPSSYLIKCVEPKVREVVAALSKQGGNINPDNYVMYEGEKIQYLCYTSEDYIPCKVQQPLLVSHVEKEIKDYIDPIARGCMQQLVQEYEKRGYDVKTIQGETLVSLAPGKINIDFLQPTTITKENSQVFSKFSIGLKSEIYDILGIATSVVQFESQYGDSEITLYMQFYPDIKIEKIKRNGDTIYIISNVVTEDSFTFATRSLVWPPGESVFGVQQ